MIFFFGIIEIRQKMLFLLIEGKFIFYGDNYLIDVILSRKNEENLSMFS